MAERLARLAALALVVILILMIPLLISLFGSLNAPSAGRTPTVQIAVAQPSPTRTVVPTDTPIATIVPTLVPSPSPTSGCPIPATPEPLWVDPVISPTNLLSQKISVTLGRGRAITVTDEAGTVTQQGQFSTAAPVEIEIPLLPNSQNNLVVTGSVEYAAGCNYTLETRIDRVGNPLVIVQSGAVTVPAPETPTPAAPGTVYLKPFSQVFALNQDTPGQSDQLYLYEAGATGAFQVMAQQGAFTHLLSQGGTLNFWTLNDNILSAPAPEPRYDDSVAGQKVEFVSEAIFGCEGQYPHNLILGLCGDIPVSGEGEVVVRAQTGSSVLYEVRLNNKLYWVSANVLKSEPN